MNSNTWILVSTLVIVGFLYQWTHIYTFVTSTCRPHTDVWLSGGSENIYTYFLCVYGLFAVWAVVEISCAHIANYQDKWFCTIVCSCALLLVVSTLGAFRAHWEMFEYGWGLREGRELTFQPLSMSSSQINTWREFERQKNCEIPGFWNKIDSQEKLETLKKEFLDKGGNPKDMLVVIKFSS